MTKLGQVDLFVQLSYVLFLGLIGGMMLQESLRALWRSRRAGAQMVRRSHVHSWVHGMPLKVKFRASGLYISVIPPLLVGAVVGFMSVIMGVMFYKMAAGLCIYFIAGSLWGMAERKLLPKKNPVVDVPGGAAPPPGGSPPGGGGPSVPPAPTPKGKSKWDKKDKMKEKDAAPVTFYEKAKALWREILKPAEKK